jgi:GT2 family glycosyltransferase
MPPARSARPSLPRPVVTAVLVAHDGGNWLDAALVALAEQRRPVDRVIAVDTGSTDGTLELLERALGSDAVVRAPSSTGFGAAVATGLAALDGSAAAGDSGATQWLWLLHDDCAPEPDALLCLLESASSSPSVAVVGPKVRSWNRPGVLVEAGFTIDSAGRRDTGLDRREVDQGQHDGVREVLAVGSAGSLVRRSVYDEVGGFDPQLPLFHDDLDFCWRVHLAGHRVLVDSEAVVVHAEAARNRRRPLAAAPDRPRRLDRRNALYTLLVNLSLPAFLLAIPRLVIGTLFRAVGMVVLKRYGDAADEIAALGTVMRHPGRIRRGRAARARTRVAKPGSIRPLLARRSTRWRHHADVAATWVADRLVTEPTTGVGALETGPSTADDDLDDIGAGSLVRRLLVRPGPLLVLGLTVVALIAGRDLISRGMLAGGQLLPVPGGASDLWSAFGAAWHPVGLGSAAVAPPYLATVATIATICFGKVWLAVDLLLIGCVPLSGLSAYLALGRLRPTPSLRVWAAATYALLPAVTGIVAGGRVGDAIAVIGLPLLIRAVAPILLRPATVGWRRVLGAGLFLAVLVAAAPLLYLVMAVAAAAFVVAAVARTRDVAGPLRCLAAVFGLLALPVVLLIPWSLTVIAHPLVLWRVPGPNAPGLQAHHLAPLDVVLAGPGGPGAPPVWITVPLIVIAFVGLLRVTGRGLALAAWVFVLGGVGVGLAVAAARVGRTGAGTAVPGWPGIATAVVGGGLVVAGIVAATGARTALREHAFGWRQPVTLVLGALAAAVPVATAVAWIADGAGGPLHRVHGSTLPAFVAAQSTSGSRPAALVLRRRSGRIGFTVLRGRGPQLGDADVPAHPSARARLATTISNLAGGDSAVYPTELAVAGIRYVVLPPPVDSRLAAAFDAMPGLARQSASGRSALWAVDAPAGRLAVLPPSLARTALSSAAPDPRAVQLHRPRLLPVHADDSARVTIAPGGSKRLLVLAEPVDTRWSAAVDGTPLPRTRAWGWAQAWTLPASGGHLDLHYSAAHRHRWVAVEAVLVGLTALAAWPGRPRRSRP